MLRRAGWARASTLNSRSRAYENSGSGGDWGLGHRDSRRSLASCDLTAVALHKLLPASMDQYGALDFDETALSSHPRGRDKG